MGLPAKINPMKLVARLRIRTKIFLSNMVIIVLLALCIGVTATLASRHYIEANSKELASHVILQYTRNMDHHIEEFTASTLFLLSDGALARIVSEQAGAGGEAQEAVSFNRASDLLYRYGNGNPYIRSIVIMNRGGRLFWWERTPPRGGEVSADMARAIAQAGADQLAKAGKGIVWSASLRGSDEVALSRHYLDINQVNRSLGVIVYHISRDYFTSLLSEGSIIQADDLNVLNDRQEALFDGRSAFVPEALLNGDQTDGQGVVSRKIASGDRESLLLQYRSPDTGWRVICSIPLSRLLEGIRVLDLLIALLCVLFIFVAMAVAFWFSIGTTRNIRTLERTMRRVEDGDLDIRAVPAGRDEIGMLAVRFNMMVSRIQELIHSVSAERLAKQQAEYAVLLAQTNPHFLYNTLGTIKWYARRSDQPAIEEMVGDLIALLKSSIRHADGPLRLADELANVRHYIHLQKIGYGDAFEVGYAIDERLLDALVPGFILQPFVENAILHGLEMSKGQGAIEIRAEWRGQDIRIEIEDNGIGMEPEAAAKLLLQDREKKRYPGLNGIGVRNVHERIRSWYGEPYGIAFDTSPGRGTRVMLTMPFRAEERSEADVQNARRGG